MQTEIRDDSQLRAIYAPVHQHHVVIAPAGYGKTYVMAKRIAYLITAGYVRPPYRVLGLTFTNTAAGAMRKKIASEVDQQFHECIDIMNFHSFCYQVLLAYGTEKGITPDFQVTDAAGSSDKSELSFDDLLVKGRALLEIPAILELYRAVYRHIVVDEFQDTSAIQLEILKLLVKGYDSMEGDKRPVMIFADKEQAIFGFRNARPENVDDACAEFKCAEPIRLEHNHRVKSQDIDALGRLLRTDNPALPAPPERKYPITVSIDETQEAVAVIELLEGLQQQAVPLHEICITAPNKYRLFKIIEGLRQVGNIPYIFIPSFKIGEIKTTHRVLIDELSAVVQEQPRAYRALRDIVPSASSTDNEEKDLVLVLLRELAHQYDVRYRNLTLRRRASIFRNHLCLEIDWGALIQERCTGQVVVSTIHGVKGLEFDYVLLVGTEASTLPHYKSACTKCRRGEPVKNALEEPARQLHVAVTRSTLEVHFFLRSTDRNKISHRPTCLLRPIQSYLDTGDGSIPELCESSSSPN